jgi:CRP/FNR family transcriptional regulator, cyclic AMP receptor protein
VRLIRNDLQDLALFSEASRSELAVIGRQLTRLNIAAGTVLVREGGRGDQFMIILEGEAEVNQDGRAVATIGHGDLVGEMALLHEDRRGRRNATVTALTDMVIYAGSPSEFRQILDAAPSVAEKVRQTVEWRALRNAA